MSVLRSVHQRRATMTVRAVDPGSRLEERLNRRRLIVARGIDERGGAVGILGIGVIPLRQQALEDRHLSIPGGEHQRGRGIGPARMDAGSLVQEVQRGGLAPPHKRKAERRPVDAGSFDLGMVRQQGVHDLGVAEEARPHEGSKAQPVAIVWIGSVRYQPVTSAASLLRIAMNISAVSSWALRSFSVWGGGPGWARPGRRVVNSNSTNRNRQYRFIDWFIVIFSSKAHGRRSQEQDTSSFLQISYKRFVVRFSSAQDVMETGVRIQSLGSERNVIGALSWGHTAEKRDCLSEYREASDALLRDPTAHLE